MRAHEFPALLSHQMGVVSKGKGDRPLVVLAGGVAVPVSGVHWREDLGCFVIQFDVVEAMTRIASAGATHLVPYPVFVGGAAQCSECHAPVVERTDYVQTTPEDHDEIGAIWLHRGDAIVEKCAGCHGDISFIVSPHDAWWAHRVHPVDGHDAVPIVVALPAPVRACRVCRDPRCSGACERDEQIAAAGGYAEIERQEQRAEYEDDARNEQLLELDDDEIRDLNR